MTSLIKKWTSLVLVAALIVTMAPLGWTPKASADSAYFQFDNLSTDKSSPVEVTTNTINVSGSFTGVSSTSIAFRIERLTDDGQLIETSTGTTTPIISNNNSTFLFVGVRIFEGLNRIVVTGVNSAGNTVEGEGYVYFANNPAITKVSLSDGRTLVADTPLLVGTANPGIIVNATNAEEVTINGVVAYSGSSGTYITTSVTLQSGYNRLEIVATNNGKTFTVTRELIYYSGNPTAYDVWADDGTNQVSLDGNPTIYLTGEQKISGKVAFPKQTTTPITEPVIWLDIYRDGNPIGTVSSANVDVNVYDTSDSNYDVFAFKTTVNYDFGTPGNEGVYVIRIRSNSLGGANYPVTFTNMNPNAIYITKIWRLYGATPDASAVEITGKTLFTDNATVNSLPLWLMLETANGIPSPADTSVKAYIDGVEQNFTYDDSYYLDDQNANNQYRIVRISSLPVGEVTLEFFIAGTVTTKTVTFPFDAAPAIRITNLYNGQKFTSAQGLADSDIKVTLVNFDTSPNSPDLDNVTITINGDTTVVDFDNLTDSVDTDDPAFTFDVDDDLVPGPNTIVVSATAQGIPVSTTITVYYFSEDEPKLFNFLPVPIDELDDSDRKIERQGTSNQYVTELETIDILFEGEDFESLHIAIDGSNLLNATVDDTNEELDIYVNEHRLTVEEEDYNNLKFKLRLNDVALPPHGGSTSVTFSAKRGPVTVSQTITIIRVVPAYKVISPKLPEEQVVKQNFLDVIIYAPGADSVQLGKEIMTPVSTNPYYFEHRVTGLKVGKNKLKFTVYQSTQEVDGEIEVTYAADYKVGAQFYTELPSSGKISVFGGDLQLTFPKNTYLKPALDSVQVDSLFTSQPILFGIADKDGRTIKTYFDFTDQEIKTITTDSTARNLLLPKSHFGLASQLYWIDPGYVDVSNPNNYEFKIGDHPYATGNIFYNRQDPAKWLKPTQRGTITIKYDEALRNEAASNLSIWRFDGTTWINLGGKVDTNKKTVTTTIDEFGFFAVMILRYSYNDIIGHDYARNALELMFARGIMDRKNANEFGVYDNITRGEFAQMLVKMLNLELDYDDNNLTFDDVPALKLPNTLWDYRYIETAVRKGIVRGRGPRLFLPNEPLTREEAAVMIARATNLLKGNEDPEKDQEQLKKQFTDGGLISYYAASSVLAIYKAGFITGAPNGTAGNGKPTYRFDPHANLKRADAAVIAERVMRKNKLL